MRLPPLNPLKAFEAAARHQSFQFAAAELNVTSGAIGRQVKALEDFLGFSLFVRVRNGIEVTPEAKTYHESLRAAFLLMEKSTAELVSGKRDGPLNVWCSRLFMRQWLLPRLSRFYALHPDCEVHLDGGRSVDALPSNTDVAIRYGTGPWDPWESHFLMGTSMFPVCSPSYATAHRRLEKPEDLLNHTLLFTAGRPDDWNAWLTSAGVSDFSITRKITLQGDGLATRAAIEGLGVALDRPEFLEPDLMAGRLIAPFNQSVRLEGSFYLIYPRSYRYPTKLVEFRNWILEEIKVPWRHCGQMQSSRAVA